MAWAECVPQGEISHFPLGGGGMKHRFTVSNKQHLMFLKNLVFLYLFFSDITAIGRDTWKLGIKNEIEDKECNKYLKSYQPD